MKNLRIGLLGLMVLGLGFTSSFAQFQYPPYFKTNLLTTGASWAVTNVTSNALSTAIIDTRKMDTVNLQLSCKADAATVSNVVFTFARSVDGTNFDSLAAKRQSVTLTLTGTTAVVCNTNLPTYGAGYLKLISVANTADHENGYITNVTVQWAEKVGAH